MLYLVCKIKRNDILQKGAVMNNKVDSAKKKPISKLSLADCYLLAKHKYIFVKHENAILVGKGK